MRSRMAVAKPAVQTFGKYQILQRIATGGMAEIYKAKLEGIGGFSRVFAIKRILPHLSQDAEYVAMLVEEAKVAGLLSHANIVQIVDLGQVDGMWYIAMEFVDGPDLGAVLERTRSKGLCLPVPHAVFIALELLKGLEYAHQRQVMRGGRTVPLKIIHRDVSPPNILLSYQGEVKLTDFGIARASHKALETRAGIIKGRYDYMSPEQASAARDLDQRSDLFSVGVVLYEMLTGTHPFRARNEVTTLERVRDGVYTPVSELNPEIPFALAAIVDRALQADRSRRFPTATAFKESLDSFFHDSGFIFTHATLESYIKGLFPDRSPHRTSSPAPVPRASSGGGSAETERARAAKRDDFLADPAESEDPTKLIDRRKLDLVPERGQDYLASEGQDATLIRSRADQEVAPEEQPTEVAPVPEVPGIGEAIDRAIERTNAARRNRRRAVSLASAATGVVLMFVGFLIGGISALVAVQVVEQATPPPAAGAAAQPELRVQAPATATVEVNGERAFGPLQVAADVPHSVRVQAQGYQPWTGQVTLVPGEVRVIVVTLTAMQPVAESP